MKKSPVKVSSFSGINNVDKAREVGGGDLQTAINVDINDQGRLLMRKGYGRVYPGEVSSLFSDGNDILFREGSCLKRLNEGFTATTLRTDMIEQMQVSYLPLNGLVYYSDGSVTGVYQDKVSRSWGLGVHPFLDLSAESGQLPAGKYLVTCTYERIEGQESGAPFAASIELPANSGIKINNIVAIDDSTVVAINIYVSAPSGEIMYRLMRVPNTSSTCIYRGLNMEYSVPLRTYLLSPPPTGNMLAYNNGRIYIVDGNIVWYTEPYRYELVSLRHNYLPFQSRVTMFAPGDNGIWVGTEDSILFMAGQDPSKVDVTEKAQYGAIYNTAMFVDGQYFASDQFTPGSSVIFSTTKGICLGTDNGTFINLTDGRVHLPYSTNGVSAINTTIGDNGQYLVGLYFSKFVTYPKYTATGSGSIS